MLDHFLNADLSHVRGPNHAGTAAFDVLTKQDFAAACAEIRTWAGYVPTPLVPLTHMARAIGVGRIDYKDEGPRFGLGSFKALGAAYAAQKEVQRHVEEQTGQPVSARDLRNGIYAEHCKGITLVSATDGNHGRSLAWGAQQLGVPCRIYIHAEVSEGRAEAIRGFGATVIRVAGDYDESVRICEQEAAANGWILVSDTSWPGYETPPRNVMAGYGLMVHEIFETLADAPTHVFLQGGVGGLAGSVAAALRQLYGPHSPRVIIVEPDKAPCLFASAEADALTEVQIAEETIMAGLSCGAPSELGWNILREEAQDFVTIPDALIPPTIRLLAMGTTGDPALDAGESAVAGLAALIAIAQAPELLNNMGFNDASRVLLIGSEGVTDPHVFAQIMAGQSIAGKIGVPHG